jgi:hypothetical protein
MSTSGKKLGDTREDFAIPCAPAQQTSSAPFLAGLRDASIRRFACDAAAELRN